MKLSKSRSKKTQSHENDVYLRDMRALVDRAEEILVASSEDQVVRDFGMLLHENWELKKRLSGKISNPEIDAAYSAALKAGAYGGKLCGAGNGGFLAFFVPPEKQTNVRESLKGLQEVDFHFEDQGSTIVYMKE